MWCLVQAVLDGKDLGPEGGVLELPQEDETREDWRGGGVVPNSPVAIKSG